MSDIELPDDLIQLQRDLDRAFAAEREYIAKVEADRLAEPAAHQERRAETEWELVERRRWNEEQNAGLHKIRSEVDRLVMAKHRHPFMAKAIADGDIMPVDTALKKAACDGETTIEPA